MFPCNKKNHRKFKIKFKIGKANHIKIIPLSLRDIHAKVATIKGNERMNNAGRAKETDTGQCQRKWQKKGERERERLLGGTHMHAYNGAETTVQPRMHFIGPMPFIVHRTAGALKRLLR